MGKVNLILLSNGISTCPGTKDTVKVTIYKVPSPIIKGFDSVCQYDANKMYYTTKVNGNSYSWTLTGGTITAGAGTDSIRANWGKGGNDTIKVTETNAIGCKTTYTKNVKVISKPSPAISGIDTVCENSTNLTYSSALNSGDKYHWTISGGTILSGTDSNVANVKWGTKGAGILTLKETNTGGCDTTVIDTIQIIASPVALINGSLNICENTTHSYTTTKGASNSYLWTLTGGTINYGSGTDSIRISWGAKGIGTLQIKITNAGGCSSTLLDTVNINPNPQINGQKSDSVCEYSGLHKYYSNQNSGSTYQWKVKFGTIISGATTDTLIVNWGASGTDSLFLTETNAYGCSTTISKLIRIFADPKPDIVGNDSVCEYTPNSIYATSSNSGSNYLWSISNGSFLSRSDSNAVSVLWNSNGSGSLSVKETNSVGCDSTVSISIVIQQKPAPVISGIDSVCQYDVAKIYTTKKNAGNTYQWSVGGGNIVSGANSDSVVVNWATSGTGSISVKETNSLLCDSSVSMNIAIHKKPTPSISGLYSVCENDTQIYSIGFTSGNTYQWTINGGNIYNGNNTNTINVLWEKNGSGSVSVKETNAVGCDTSITQDITIIAKPKPVISGNKSVCPYDTAQTYSANNVAGDTFQWAVNGGNIISGNGTSSIQLNWLAAGTGKVTITQTNSSGCDTTVSLTVTINPKPKPAIVGNDSVCQFRKGVMYQTKYTFGNTYLWFVNNGSVKGKSDSNMVFIDWGSGITSASISVTETNIFGCDSSNTLNISIIAPPVPLISGKDSICQYTSGINYITPSHTGSIYNWLVNGGNIVSGNGTNSIMVDWGSSGSGVINVSEANALGCDSSASDTIIIIAKPAPVIVGASSLCEHVNSSVYSVAANNGDTLFWTVVGGTIINGQGCDSVTVHWGSAGNGSVLLKASNSGGCDTTVSKSVTINPLPKPYILGKDSVCRFTLNEIYSTALNNGSIYIWSATGEKCNPSGSNSVGVDWGKDGTGKVYVIETSKLGCDTSVTKKVLIMPRPMPVIIGKDTVCEFSKQNNYSVNVDSGAFNKWTVSGGRILGNDSGNTIQVDWNAKGIGSISVRQVSLAGCDTTIQIAVQIIGKPTPVITGQIRVCANTGGHVYAAPNIPGNQYQWNILGGTIDSANQNTIKVTWDSVCKGTLTLREINSLGCDSTVSIDISIEKLNTSISSDPLEGCVSSPIYFNCNPDSNVISFNWNFGDNTTSKGRQPQHSYKQAGAFNIALISQSKIGCVDTSFSMLNVYDNPTADFDIIYPTADKIIYNLEDKLILDDKSKNAVSWLWNFGDGTTSTQQNPSDHIYTKPGDYKIKLIVQNSYGCSDSITKTIKVGAHVRLYIPNAFSPNRDGLNDSFSIFSLNITELNIIVFDRWGEKIYESNDVKFRWDGTYRSKQVPNEVYIYIVQALDIFRNGAYRTGIIAVYR